MTVSPPLNPILMELSGNGSLAGRDRAGAFSAIGSGALRYAPAPGARVNRVTNPRLASGATGWSGGTRVADSDFAGGWAWEITSAVQNTGGGFIPVWGIPNEGMTISFDVKWISGEQATWYIGTQQSGVSNSGGAYTLSAGDLDGQVHRCSVTTNTATNIDRYSSVQVWWWRGSGVPSGTSTIRVSNLVVESGVVANPTYFDGASSNAVWLDTRSGQVGSAHASMSAQRASFYVEEATTNLVPNPWRATDNTGYSATGGSTARSTLHFYQGPAAGLLTATGANCEEVISITAAASSHTAQTIVRNNTASARQCQLVYNGSLIGSPTSVAAGSVSTITAAFTGTGGAANLGVRWIDSLNTETFVTYYLGAEAKTYATSPCPALDSAGTITTGYTWAGTAHASASTRAVVSVNGTVANRINSATGTLMMRAYSLSAPETPRYINFGGWYAASPNLSMILWSGGPNDIRASATADGGVTEPGIANGISTSVVGRTSIPYMDWSWPNPHRVGDSSVNDIIAAASAGNISNQTFQGGTTFNVQTFSGSILEGPFVIYDSVLSDARRTMVNAAIDSNGAIDLWTLFEEWEGVLSPLDIDVTSQTVTATAGASAILQPLDAFALGTGSATAGASAIIQPLDIDMSDGSVKGYGARGSRHVIIPSPYKDLTIPNE